MQPLQGGIDTIAGRTPIACINCASAKTGCDKRVPCSRCAYKHLPCGARFARRSWKAAVRSASSHSRILAQSPNNDLVNADHGISEDVDTESCTISSASKINSELHANSQKTGYPLQAMHFVTDAFEASPNGIISGINDSIYLNENFLNRDIGYRGLMAWNEYPFEFELYSDTANEEQISLEIPISTEPSKTSPNSEAMASGFMSTTLLQTYDTRTTSVAPQVDSDCMLEIMEVGMPTKNGGKIPESEGVITAEAAWPLARCSTQISSEAPARTAIAHLESLENNSKHEGMWKSLNHDIAPAELNHRNRISVVPLSASTRDRILAITQRFLHTALETHKGDLEARSKVPGSPKLDGEFKFLVLPPSHVLEYFLRSYVDSLAPYYTLVNAGVLDPNELLLNNQASTLLLLLMIAHGAMTLPSAEARCLAAGLTETCRISLFNIIEKYVELSADPVVLRCALLLTMLEAWSGDAWHMNIAIGQRGMYLAMLKLAGMLGPQLPTMTSCNGSSSREVQWRAWLQRENRNRLVYNWVMMDQELSLFYDTAPILSITEIEGPTPSPERLWLAKDLDEWLTAVKQTSSDTDCLHFNLHGSLPHLPSLRSLFQDMLNDNMDKQHSRLLPLQLKLLLHPLYSILYQTRQVLSCFSDVFGSHRGSRTITKASTSLRLEEIQSLLQKWYEICMDFAKADPSCPVTQANLVLYHLISLNAVTSFPEIERLARKEGLDGSSWEFSLRHKRCIYQSKEALFHCGQVLRLLCSMQKDGRPHWWSVAIYRATMILWVESMSRMDPQARTMEKGQIFAIDAVMPEHPSILSYLWDGEGLPVLTKVGGYIRIDRPEEVLSHCISLLDLGVALRMSDGIKRKLQTLFKSWDMISTQNHT